MTQWTPQRFAVLTTLHRAASLSPKTESYCSQSAISQLRAWGTVQSKGLVDLMSMIEADPELSTDPTACCSGQIVAATVLQKAVSEMPFIFELLLQVSSEQSYHLCLIQNLVSGNSLNGNSSNPIIGELALRVQEIFLEGLVLMVDEGRPAMQLAAVHLLTQLANTYPGREAICQVSTAAAACMQEHISPSRKL